MYITFLPPHLMHLKLGIDAARTDTNYYPNQARLMPMKYLPKSDAPRSRRHLISVYSPSNVM